MARQRNRQPGPINRTIIPARPTPTLGTDPSLRPATISTPSGAGIRRSRAKGGGMPSGNGRGMSDWHRPANLPYSLSVTTCDRRWDDTTGTI